MADSENSRTLPAITRRKMLSATTVYVNALAINAVHVQLGSHNESRDPVLGLWRRWMEAHGRVVELCRRQQLLETRLFSMIGPPSLSPLAWEEADKMLGYSEMKQAEETAWDVECDLAEELWNSPAQSISGVTAKLSAMLERGQPSSGSAEFPWPQMRSVIADLLILGGS